MPASAWVTAEKTIAYADALYVYIRDGKPQADPVPDDLKTLVHDETEVFVAMANEGSKKAWDEAWQRWKAMHKAKTADATP